jgi:hypothetical protein
MEYVVSDYSVCDVKGMRVNNTGKGEVMNLKNLLSYSTIRLALAAAVSCLLVQSANATLLFSEGFNYTSGSALSGNGPWTSGSAPPLQIGTGNLTYPSLPDLGGNDLVDTSGAASSGAANFNASPITSGTIYYSFVLQPTALPTANSYLTDILNTGATPNGSGDPLSVYVGQQTAGSTYKIGIRHSGVGTGATFAPSNAGFTLNSVNFFVVAYTFGSGGSESLWVNPTLGAGSAPAADVTIAAGGTEATGLQEIGFKANSATTAGNWNFDTLRVGDTWADVTPAVPEPSSILLAGAGVGLMLMMIRRRRS